MRLREPPGLGTRRNADVVAQVAFPRDECCSFANQENRKALAVKSLRTRRRLVCHETSAIKIYESPQS